MLDELIQRLFAGSTKSLVLNLIEHDTLSPGDIDEVKAAIAALEEEP
jgi:predicted transcriptional regulator